MLTVIIITIGFIDMVQRNKSIVKMRFNRMNYVSRYRETERVCTSKTNREKIDVRSIEVRERVMLWTAQRTVDKVDCHR